MYYLASLTIRIDVIRLEFMENNLKWFIRTVKKSNIVTFFKA